LDSQFIRSIRLSRDKVDGREFPFNLPAIKNLKSLDLHKKVTFFVGENGSGKSTLLEALAVAMGFNAEGGTVNFNFSTKATHSNLHEHLIVTKGVKEARNGFFLRAESFYNVASEIDRLDKESPQPLMPSYGGISLHEQSHGESFFSLMQNRFGSEGLYLLDEPEAALSASRQMSMLVLMHGLIQENCQFVIATHSPILLAYPNALIYEIRDGCWEKTAFEDTETYTITKQFLNNHQRMLNNLLDD